MRNIFGSSGFFDKDRDTEPAEKKRLTDGRAEFPGEPG
jgi:hypothetical protein